MYTIILDSSNTILCVALAKNNLIIDEISYEAWQRQSELMIPELSKILDRNKIQKEDISEVIVANGPGSYTGVRIAVTIAKTLGVTLGINVYAISSLEAQKLCKIPTICLINARSNRSYIGVYKDNEVILSDRIMKNDEVMDYIKSHPEYKITGELDYLNIEGSKYHIAQGLLSSKSDLNKVDNVLSLKPVYMKD